VLVVIVDIWVDEREQAAPLVRSEEERRGRQRSHGRRAVQVVRMGGVGAGEHPAGDVPGRGAGAPHPPAAGRLGRSLGAVLLLADVPERRPPLTAASRRRSQSRRRPPPDRRVSSGVVSSSGRRVVDGSSTAAAGHERQEPHQLPAHAPPLYRSPPRRPPPYSMSLSLSLLYTVPASNFSSNRLCLSL
jgi:hypothetical protein